MAAGEPPAKFSRPVILSDAPDPERSEESGAESKDLRLFLRIFPIAIGRKATAVLDGSLSHLEKMKNIAYRVDARVWRPALFSRQIPRVQRTSLC